MRRALLISLIAFAVLAGDARACTCVPPDWVLPDAERVFVATVTERRGSVLESIYTLRVERVLRGAVPSRMVLRSGYEEGSCVAELTVGDRVGVMLTQPGDRVNMCHVTDPESLGAGGGAPVPADLLAALLGSCRELARRLGL